MKHWLEEQNASTNLRAARAFGYVWRDRERMPRARFGGQLPDFLIEYLIGVHGLEQASQLVEQHFPTMRNRQLLKYRLIQ